MESLHLPQDLYWDGKMEPSSPSSELFSLGNSEESWIFEDNFAKDVLLDETEVDEKFNLNETIIEGELLMEFEYDVEKEQWLDQKPDIQHILDYPPGIIQPQPVTAQLVKVQNPYDIILELEKIYDVTELAQLTPPQTPPQELNVATKDVFDFAPIKQLQQHQQQPISEISNNGNFPTPPQTIIPQIYPTNEMLDYSSDSTGSPMSPDIAREMQIVDEIIQDRAKDLPDWNDDDSMYSMSSSSASQNDDDWLPNSSSSSVSSESSPTSVKSGKMTNAGVTKKRVRPYGRGIEDKKSRKKEQNKNAATRYRQKKKQEMEEILEEERILVKRNDELLRNVSEVEREIKYLKQLMREFYKTKGLLK